MKVCKLMSEPIESVATWLEFGTQMSKCDISNHTQGWRGPARLPLGPAPAAGGAPQALQPPPVRHRVLPRRPDQLLPQLSRQPQEEQGLRPPRRAQAAQPGVLLLEQQPVPRGHAQVVRPDAEVGLAGDHQLRVPDAAQHDRREELQRPLSVPGVPLDHRRYAVVHIVIFHLASSLNFYYGMATL